MKILRLRLENLNSLKIKQTVDFTTAPLSDTGLFAITGDTGAGKTTLLDAITLALYGRVHRNKEVTEVMSYGATESLAEVEFESAKGLFRAKWSTYRSRRKLDGNIQPPRRELARWDKKAGDFRIIAEKIREVDTAVEEVSGLDYDRFTRSVLLSQGDFAAFLQAGERERSDLLERITGTEVYTRISIAAYERYRTEQSILADLRKEQEALKLLQTEEIEAIEADLAGKQASAEALQKELDQTRSAIQWHQQWAALEQARGELSTREAEWREKQTAFRDQETRLAAHHRAKPHQSLLDKTRNAEEQITVLGAELHDLKQQQEITTAALTEKQSAVTESNNNYQKILREKEERLPLFDRVMTMDRDLEAKQESLAERIAECTVIEQELERAAATQKDLLGQIADHEQEIVDLEAWTVQHADRAELGKLLPEVDQKREEMREIVGKQKKLEKEHEDLQSERSKILQQFEKVSDDLDKAKSGLEQLNRAFQEDLPPGYGLGRNELLRNLNRDIEQLGEQQTQLLQLQEFNREYQELLTELLEYEAQLESLNGRETLIDKEVISAMDALDAAREQLEYHQAVYEQQQLIANYEKDRHQLKEGDPCPLCQSTHHPFRDHPVKPYVDRARTRYEKSKAAFDKVLNRQNQLLNRQKEIKIQKDQLMGQELQELGGQMARQIKRIELIEERVAGMILGLDTGQLESDRGPGLEKKINEAAAQMRQKKEIRDRLLKISDALDAQEKIVLNLDHERREYENQLRIVDERINTKRGDLTREEERYRALLQKVEKIFNRFGQAFEPERAKTVYAQLKADYEAFLSRTGRLQELQQSIRLDRQKVEQLEESQVKESLRYKSLKLRREEAENKMVELTKERQSLLGDQDPNLEKEKLLQAEQRQFEQLNALKEEVNELNARQRGILPLSESKEKEKQQWSGQLIKWQEALLTAAREAGFSNREALQEALLEAAEAERLLHEKNELEKEELAIRQSLKDLEAGLQKLEKTKPSDTSLPALEAHLEERENDYQQLQRTIGGLSERLSANEKQQKAAGKLVKRIGKQELVFARWARLNEIIGQADGKKFRIFAQGLTLAKLVELANFHLESLNGRYLIRKRSDDDLELEIVDTFQADNARSMNTLSGGESFLVSLSLALGLSDLAGRDARIQSLFIDEGFGTLDENSLDMAIDTLENLQSDGKTIGIISHVKALKERIGTQIQVTKKGTGFSEIAIVG